MVQVNIDGHEPCISFFQALVKDLLILFFIVKILYVSFKIVAIYCCLDSIIFGKKYLYNPNH